MKKRILIFGGTFDPPHIGHIETARHVLKELEPDIMLVFPAGIPPHKLIGLDASPCDRFRMAKLAFEPIERETGTPVIVSDREIRRKKVSYTIDTVEEIRNIFGDAEIYLYMGSDMTCTIDRWYRYEDLIGMCRIVTVRRFEESEKDKEKVFREKCEMIREKGSGIKVIEKEVIKISSTDIREEIKTYCEKCDKQSKIFPSLLTEEVFRYIISRNIYSNQRENQ